jgi:putative ABC transport system permease protein
MVTAVMVPLAMATAVSAALFSIADGLLLRALPFPDADRLVSIDFPEDEGRLRQLRPILGDPAARSAFSERLESIPLLEARAIVTPLTYFDRNVAAAAQVRGAPVSPNFFEMFGLRPAMGRAIDASDAVPAPANPAAAALPVVIGHGLWMGEFGGDAGVIGRNVELAGRTVTVVGIMDAGVKFPGETNVWMPLSSIGVNDFRGFARLAPGATAEQLQGAFPALNIQPLEQSVRRTGAVPYVLIFATTLALLFMSWVQVAALMLSRAADRLKELAVRASMGASTGRLVSLFAADAIWLSLGSLALAAAVVPSLTALLVSWLPASLRFGQYLQADARTFAFAGAATGLGVVVISIAPISLIRRVSPLALLAGTLGEGRRSVSVSRARRLLLVAQIALTTVLLYVAGLSVHSLVRVLSFDYGFDDGNVLVADLPLLKIPETEALKFRSPYEFTPGEREQRAAEWKAWTESNKQATIQSLDALKALPGVIAVAGLTDTPIPRRTRLTTAGTEVTRVGNRPTGRLSVRLISASQDFVKALGATLLAGESFDAPSVSGRLDVMVINEAFARRIQPLVWPIGIRVVSSNMTGTVIGVVKNLVDSAPGIEPEPQIFQPLAYRGAGARVAIVRTEGDADTAASAVRDVLQSKFGPLRTDQIRLLAADVDATVVPWHGRSSMLMLVAFLCVPLAMLGMSSGLFFAVNAQSREIGIKLALGASPSQARRNVIETALRLTSIGGAIGVVVGMAIGTVMDNQLFEVSPVDPVVVVVISGGMLALCWCSALGPGSRASHIDPVVVLKNHSF